METTEDLLNDIMAYLSTDLFDEGSSELWLGQFGDLSGG